MSNMAKRKQKLELTWIGKDEEVKLEPRILIEDPTKSYGDPASENMLIHGDNLLALKALEQDFAGKIKCIYIDPPYNTGARIDADGKEIGYEDNLEHSTWLNLMKPRLELLHRLLSPNGSMFVSIDNNEFAYLQVLMDEIFSRKNKKNAVIIKRGSVTGAKVINPGLVNISEFVLVYTKDASKWTPNRLLRKKDRDERYGTYIENHDDNYSMWKYVPLMQVFASRYGLKSTQVKKHFGDEFEERLLDFISANSERIVRFASLDDKSISKAASELKRKSLENKGTTLFMEREGKNPYYVYNGNVILFVRDRLQVIDGEQSFSEPLTDIWDDVLPNDLHNEGGVDFRKGKKPEKLIQRIFELASNEGDIVLDSFLGSGSTAAVAIKMNRRWIGIEMGEHANTHCIPRLKNVIDGEQRGISKAVNWKGGGGFKFYNLAPSLLKQDTYGNWVIDEKYNATMLAHSVSKHEGFRFDPHAEMYWKQGKSTETDFIFVTTNFVTVEQLDMIYGEMLPGESLLICAKSFAAECESKYPNITTKKIPKMILGKCEFGKENYDLNIIEKTDEVAEEQSDNN